MRERSVHDEVLDALAVSGLLEASLAVLLLRGEGRMEVHPLTIACAGLLRTYEIRLRHIRSMSSEHAHRLAEATAEFVSNLESHRPEAGQWLTIRGNDEVHFNIFRLESGPLLGCLPVVSQLDVSIERWNELWGSNA